ncbi:MAG: hypothetical protein ACYCW6_25360, partial [Candidatus Xenobia bacterium]
MRARLGRLLLVSDEEWPVLLALTGLSALLVGTNVIGMTAAVSLFLSRVGVEALPRMYPLAAIAVLALSPLYLRLIDRLPRRTVLLVSFAVFTVLPLLMRVFVSRHAALYALFVEAYFTSQYDNMQFWLMATDLVDTRAARRLFGIVNGGGSIGAAICGLAARPLAAWLM